MQDIMLEIVDNYGYLGIFLLIFIENAFPPIPSEAVLLLGGALTVTTSMNIPGTIVAATLGSLAGAILLYEVGRIFQANRLKKLFSGKIGKILHLKPEFVDKAEQWFVKYESKAVLICRCIPIVRSIISIPAGFAKMNLPKFLLLTTIGSLAWNTILVSIGSALGSAWETAMPYFKRYSHIALIVIVCLAIAFVTYLLIKKFRKKAKTDYEA